MADFPPLDLKPMEARAVDDLPSGPGWQFEPKYDGFRCLAFRTGGEVHLQSKNQKPLQRYFPELQAGLSELTEDRFALDGEIVIPGQSFEVLQLRLHPAASRVDKLSCEHPAQLVVFDMLAREGASLLSEPLSVRRAALESFVDALGNTSAVQLGRRITSAETAREWLGEQGLDGIVAKRLDLPYQPGARAMEKFKIWHTVDCVVGGLYLSRRTGAVESLLLGLYDDAGLLHYVGKARAGAEGEEMAEVLQPLTGRGGFTGRAPGGTSRWTGRERDPVPLEPVLVVEVSADHITGEYMRHGARLLRVREDKRPEDCRMDQIR